MPDEQRADDLYLDLLSHCLTGRVDRDDLVTIDRPAGRLKRLVFDLIRSRGLELAIRRPVDWEPSTRESWPTTRLTMIGPTRLASLRDCVEAVLDAGVPGDLIEAGVWRGGAALFMKAVLAAHGDTERRVWLADSFRGLPAPNAERYPADAGNTLLAGDALAVPLETVRSNFERYRLLDDRVRFVEGWFEDTLPVLRNETFAVVRLDGDLYGSTMTSLANLYPALSPGGFVIVDDYGDHQWAAGQAVDDYRSEHGIDDPLHRVDGACVFWQKSG